MGLQSPFHALPAAALATALAVADSLSPAHAGGLWRVVDPIFHALLVPIIAVIAGILVWAVCAAVGAYRLGDGSRAAVYVLLAAIAAGVTAWGVTQILGGDDGGEEEQAPLNIQDL